MVSIRVICIGLLIIGAVIIVMMTTIKPFKIREHFDMESKCNHCCINSETNCENKCIFQNGVVCDCCRNYK